MDKIEKALKRLSLKERDMISSILVKIGKRNFLGLNIQKLRGENNVYRARKGDLRIIYRETHGNEIFILAIERRSEKTYRKF